MNKSTKYHLFLISIFLIFWIWAAINPKYPESWLHENLLIFIFIPIIILSGRYFKLSNLSYTLITIFMIMHVIGSHYTYAEVSFGYVLQDWFNSSRNMYDRLVHFSFGLLLFYPIKEIFSRIAKVKGIWELYLPVELIIAFSAIYELLEWGLVQVVDPTAGLAFLGAQGDIWDAQKDMALAALGSGISMITLLIFNLKNKKNYKREIKDSIKINSK